MEIGKVVFRESTSQKDDQAQWDDAPRGVGDAVGQRPRFSCGDAGRRGLRVAVSYTHLTLPTKA